MRAFVAVPLPRSAVALLRSVRETLLDADPSWCREKWVPAQNLHVTLRFLGEVREEGSEDIASRLTEVAAAHHPFSLYMERIQAVPGSGRARMLWASMGDAEGGCARLAEDVRDALLEWCPLEEDPRPFRPHVTLARARNPRRIAAPSLIAANALLGHAEATGQGVVSVRRVILLASTLTPSGPLYREVAEAPLAED